MRTRRYWAALATLATLLFGLAPPPAHAQHRDGGHHAAARPPVAARPYHGYPHGGYYPYRYGWGFGVGYPYGYVGYPAPWAYGGIYVNMGSVRLQVKPRDTEVYVDGYIAGTVDDFDGTFQRMRLPAGEHEIVLYREGHRSARQTLYLTPGADLRIRHVMQPLAAGEPNEPRPVAPPPPVPRLPSEAGPARPDDTRTVEPGEFGTLAVRVQPPGAEILIDGERWQGPEGFGPLEVKVAAGPHRVEVRKSGYVAYATEVIVRAGETETLNVSLPLER